MFSKCEYTLWTFAGVLTETTAELALALTFAAARRVVEGDKFMRAGKYEGWLPQLFVGAPILVAIPLFPTLHLAISEEPQCHDYQPQRLWTSVQASSC